MVVISVSEFNLLPKRLTKQHSLLSYNYSVITTECSQNQHWKIPVFLAAVGQEVYRLSILSAFS